MSFKIGDEVWLQVKNIHMLQPSHKLDYWQLSPFTIIDVWGKQAYKLKLLHQYKAIHSVFHVLLLESYHACEDKPLSQGPILVNRQEKWVVEEILDHYESWHNCEYLVWWKEYLSEKDSWEPEVYLTDIFKILKIYKKKHKL